MSKKNQNKLDFKKTSVIKVDGGKMSRATKKEFPVLTDLAVHTLDLKSHGLRKAHLHPNANQVDYCVSGQARVGIIGPDGKKELFNLNEGDMSFVPKGYVHWIENIGKTDLKCLLILSNSMPSTIEINRSLLESIKK